MHNPTLSWRKKIKKNTGEPNDAVISVIIIAVGLAAVVQCKVV